MKTIRTLKTTLSAKFESFINEVENQEAVIESAIIEIKEAIGSTTVQIRSVERGLHCAVKRNTELQKEIIVWQERAKEVKSIDPSMVEGCIKKVILLKDESTQSQKNIDQANKSLLHLQHEKEQIQSKLREVETKKLQMSSKETRLRVDQIQIGQTNRENIDDVFNRWEDRLVMKENTQEPEIRDEVSEYFDTKENQERVKKEMDLIFNS
jgi:phage shock protein A